MGHRLILSLVLLCLSTPPVLARQPSADADASPSAAPEEGKVEEVEDLAKRAKAHYAGKRYSEAVATYLKAYYAAPAAAVLYNIAHIYDRKLHESDLAADFYRRYISSPDADPIAVKKATNRLQELKAEKAARALKAQMTPVKITPPVVVPVKPTPAPAPMSTPQEPPSSALRTIGIITSVVGVGLITGGVVMGLKADQNLESFKLSTDLAEKKGFRDDGETQALVADVLYGVGGAVLIGGVVMILLQPDTKDTAIRIGPTADGHGATVLWGGAL